MPRSTTASLMASVSVDFSAARPSQMKKRLIARKKPMAPSRLRLLPGARPAAAAGRLLLLEEDLLLEDVRQLLGELRLVRRAEQRRALGLDRLEHRRIDVECDEVGADRGLRPLGLPPEVGEGGRGRLAPVALPVRH